jgi:hypothetical protein
MFVYAMATQRLQQRATWNNKPRLHNKQDPSRNTYIRKQTSPGVVVMDRLNKKFVQPTNDLRKVTRFAIAKSFVFSFEDKWKRSVKPVIRC